jgi:hypothetical protein
MLSRNNVRSQFILYLRDLVLEVELLLLQATQPELISATALLKRMNGIVEVTMFAPQDFKPDTDDFKMIHSAGFVH